MRISLSALSVLLLLISVDLPLHASNGRGATANVAPVALAGTSRVKGDIDGDGKGDLVWHNSVTQENYAWIMNGATVTTAFAFFHVCSPNFYRADIYEAVGVADFSGDGRADLLWRDATLGVQMIWVSNMIPNWWMEGRPMRQVSPPWTLGAVGDFNGDGKADIVWRNSVTGDDSMWLVTGTPLYTGVQATGVALPAVPDPTWRIVAAGDLNGDGIDDLVWHNAVAGTSAVWFMDGTANPVTRALPKVVDTNWIIAGVGDIDGDGKADIIWRNPVTGENHVWLMNGDAISAAGSLPPVYGSDWTIVRISDLDGDGRADIVWHNSASGNNSVWFLNGISVTSSASLPSMPTTDWHIAGAP